MSECPLLEHVTKTNQNQSHKQILTLGPNILKNKQYFTTIHYCYSNNIFFKNLKNFALIMTQNKEKRKISTISES